MWFLPLFLLFLFPFGGGEALGGLSKFEVYNSKKFPYSLKEACQSMASSSTPVMLIDIIDVNKIDCMGKTLWANQFCQIKMEKNPSLIRGFVDKAQQAIICQTGDRVLLHYDCEKPPLPNSSLCQNDREGCQKLKDLLVQNLNLYHHSLTSIFASDQKTLSCHFIKNEKGPLEPL